MGVWPKLSVVGSMDRAATACPSPCRVAVAVPPGAAVADRPAVSVPVDPGSNCTATVHEPPPGRAAPQVVPSIAKAPALGPLRLRATAPDVAWPVLVTVNVWSPELVPSGT